MAIAAAFVTSDIKLFHLPFGGSITLFSMLFLVLIGYWYGLRAGLMTAIAYGFLQLVSDPYIISIPQMLVDYIFAFGALGLSPEVPWKTGVPFLMQVHVCATLLQRKQPVPVSHSHR